MVHETTAAHFGPLWITEDDVRALMSLNEAMDALAAGLVREATGDARNIDKALGTWSNSSMHVLGSMMPSAGFVAFKTWANTPRGAAAVLSMFSAIDGRLLAMMEAATLGQLRTAAICGLATQHLAAKDAAEMALIGTGAQALMQVAAVAASRSLRNLRVYSPTRERRAAFVASARKKFDFEVHEADSVEEAVEGAPIVTLITRAKTPFLRASMIRPGTHINAPGAILPGHAEFAQDIFNRVDRVVVDNIANAQKTSTELIERFGKDPAQWQEVRTLGDVLQQAWVRPADADITLFKPMGMGLSDLAVAVAVYERATTQRVGVPLAQGQRGVPRWRSA